MIQDETLTIRRKGRKGNALEPHRQADSLIDMKHRGRYDLMWARLEPLKKNEEWG